MQVPLADDDEQQLWPYPLRKPRLAESLCASDVSMRASLALTASSSLAFNERNFKLSDLGELALADSVPVEDDVLRRQRVLSVSPDV